MSHLCWKQLVRHLEVFGRGLYYSVFVAFLRLRQWSLCHLKIFEHDILTLDSGQRGQFISSENFWCLSKLLLASGETWDLLEEVRAWLQASRTRSQNSRACRSTILSSTKTENTNATTATKGTNSSSPSSSKGAHSSSSSSTTQRTHPSTTPST